MKWINYLNIARFTSKEDGGEEINLFISSKMNQNIVVLQSPEKNSIRAWFYFAKDDVPIASQHHVFVSSDNNEIEKNYFLKAVQWLKELVATYGLEDIELHVYMTEPPGHFEINHSFLKITEVNLYSDNVDVFRWLLPQLPQSLRYLSLNPLTMSCNQIVIPSDILSSPQVTNCENLFFACPVNFSNSQFSSLNAERLCFETTDLDERSVNNFLKKWSSGLIGYPFSEFTIKLGRPPNFWHVCQGLKTQSWGNIFEKLE
ncbi:hypothetical protein GCK72_025370 [Caenorhabditis remanei]|uniref:F-box associated domain-containing protein n=1 Tax=Caenorhabditis remanei TaxID=31234 RepID=A0A6A5G281_CAERE|nr:hypothetical protein GCK72_025370 [Caenorhabditis remanei]KAF1748903.1 hypothetical protein GCK72_025370 [Caenorhabditis remanei]